MNCVRNIVAWISTVMLLGALSVGSVQAQDRERPSPPEPAENPVRPRPIAPDAQREQREAFFQSLDGLSAYSRRRVQLERARSVARFDLDWGME